MKVLWPFGVALQGEMSSHLNAALAEDRCGKRLGKRRRESRQAGIRKASESDPLLKHRKRGDGIKTGVGCIASGSAWREPVYWPGGVRCEGGASLVCGYCTELGKAWADTVAAPVVGVGARGRASSSRNCEALSTDADALADQFVVVMKHL